MPRRESSYEVGAQFRLPDLGPALHSYKEETALIPLVSSSPDGPVTTVAFMRSHRYRLPGVKLIDTEISTATHTQRSIRLVGAAEAVSTVEGQLLVAGAREVAPGSRQLERILAAEAEANPVVDAIRSGVRRILVHDPLVRQGDPLPNGDTPVHQMRVGCRRLRSDLKTFASQLRRPWAKSLREELGWLAGHLGGARDIEVLRARLARTAAADPLAAIDGSAVERMDAALAARQSAAIDALAQAMQAKRYLDLVGQLTRAALNPPLVRPAGPAATPVAPAELDPPGEHAPDEEWHRWRIEVKRARYATEALKGRKHPRARELAHFQDLLGEHQDAAVAADTWLSFATDPELAVTAGRLYERERVAIREVRAEVVELLRNSCLCGPQVCAPPAITATRSRRLPASATARYAAVADKKHS
jgi:CHAD domain-containing protein